MGYYFLGLSLLTFTILVIGIVKKNEKLLKITMIGGVVCMVISLSNVIYELNGGGSKAAGNFSKESIMMEGMPAGVEIFESKAR